MNFHLPDFLITLLLLKAGYPPTSSVSSFWSPITPPEGLGDGGPHQAGGPDSAAASASLRQPPALVQMQVCQRRCRQSFTTFYQGSSYLNTRTLSLTTVKTISGESSQRVTSTPPLHLKLSIRSLPLLLSVHERDGAALLLPRHGSAPQLHLTLRDEPELLAQTLTFPGH